MERPGDGRGSESDCQRDTSLVLPSARRRFSRGDASMHRSADIRLARQRVKTCGHGTPFEGTGTMIRRMRHRAVPVLQGVLLAGSFLFLTAVIVGAVGKEHDSTAPGVAGFRGKQTLPQVSRRAPTRPLRPLLCAARITCALRKRLNAQSKALLGQAARASTWSPRTTSILSISAGTTGVSPARQKQPPQVGNALNAQTGGPSDGRLRRSEGQVWNKSITACNATSSQR